jgi:DUF1680 family protein
MRLLASLDTYLATKSDRGVQVHQFATGTIDAGAVRLSLGTDYPWQGDVRIEVLASGDAPWELALRIPPWVEGATVTHGGQPAEVKPGEYARIRRSWSDGDVVVLSLPLATRLVRPHPRMDAVRRCIAIERGPIVYCLEAPDVPHDVAVDDVRVRVHDATAARPEHRHDLLEGVTILTTRLVVLDDAPIEPYRAVAADAGAEGRASPTPLELRLIPYYAWGNRSPGPMRVWLPQAADGPESASGGSDAP